MTRRSVPRVGLRLARRRRDERGAYAILMSMMLVLVMALAAIAVDIASQVDSKQQLKDTMDAAAHAGAYSIDGNVNAAKNEVKRVAKANDPSANPAIDTWCVVASTGPTKQVNSSQIPSNCNPGKGEPYNTSHYPGLICDATYCFIPCDPSLTMAKCNTVRVTDEKTVPYAFAPAIGYDEGSTGSVVSIACKGPCGTDVENPMDVVIMADRTLSMEDGDRESMKSAIEDSLKVMDPRLQYVALGTLHKSAPRRMNRNSGEQCATAEGGVKQTQKWVSSGWFGGSYEDQWNSNGTPKLESDNKVGAGKWIAADFSKSYLTEGDTPQIAPNDPLVKALRCMPAAAAGGYGTMLAAALKGAARYLIYPSENNLSSLPVREGKKPRKVIIFETDGNPDETFEGGSKVLSTTSDPAFGRQKLTGGDTGNGVKGCNGFLDVANAAKAQDITIITIGFGDANNAGCERVKEDSYGNLVNPKAPWVRDYLAAAASDHPVTGESTTAENCGTATGRATENSDGDYFFCAANGADLQEVFQSALNSLSTQIKFLKMPRA